MIRILNNPVLKSGSQWVYCDQGKIKKEMKNKQYWKDKWESCTIHLLNSFLLKCLLQCKGERSTKDFWKFHCNVLFSSCSFLCQSSMEITANWEWGSSFVFFCFIFSLCLHDWHTQCFTFRTVTFPPQTAFKSRGAPAREQPCQMCPSASDTSTYTRAWKRS